MIPTTYPSRVDAASNTSVWQENVLLDVTGFIPVQFFGV